MKIEFGGSIQYCSEMSDPEQPCSAAEQPCSAAQPTTSDECDGCDEPCGSCSSRLSSEPASPRADILKVKLLSAAACLPVRAKPGDAGLDLFSAETCTVPARGRRLVHTDIAVSIPVGCYGRVAPRSGLSIKKSIDIGGGVIDSEYRGEVGVIIINGADSDFEIVKGDRIAQLILERYLAADVVLVEQLDETDRGDGGFGSTG